jgi:hypothetical protein
MWQHKSKPHLSQPNIKVAAAEKCSLAAFKAALVFIPIIVMLLITSLNLISVAASAAFVATSNCDGVCDVVNDGVNASVCERM